MKKFCLFLFCFCILLAVHPGEVTHLRRYLELDQLLTQAEKLSSEQKREILALREQLMRSENERKSERKELQRLLTAQSEELIASTTSLQNSESLLQKAYRNAEGDQQRIKTLETTITRLKGYIQFLAVLTAALIILLVLCVVRILWMTGKLRIPGMYHPP